MCMKLTDMGSQYLVASYDSNKQYFDGAKNYKCTLPANIPESQLLVVHGLFQPDPLDAPDAAAFPACG